MPLLDAAPLIMAHELGHFRQEGLEVELRRQIGWANIRDKLTFGHLDAGHALLGMPLASHQGRDSFVEPLTALMGLGTGGNAITIRKELHDLGVRSAVDLAKYLHSARHNPMLIGHVFNTSTHHYLLRDWLDSGVIDPDHDVSLCVIPPPQMPDHMRGGYVDIFCVGEPWNTLATRRGYGVATVATTDIVPNHPEKVLAVTERFAAQHPEVLVPLVRAVLRACAWCDLLKNRAELATVLARKEYIAQPNEILEQSLAIDRRFGESRAQQSARPNNWQMKSFAPANTFPSKMHPVWLMKQMIRWGHLHAEADVLALENHCCDSRPYRAAAASLEIACPAEDFAPMELRNGQWLTLETLAAHIHAAAAIAPTVHSADSPAAMRSYALNRSC